MGRAAQIMYWTELCAVPHGLGEAENWQSTTARRRRRLIRTANGGLHDTPAFTRQPIRLLLLPPWAHLTTVAGNAPNGHISLLLLHKRCDYLLFFRMIKFIDTPLDPGRFYRRRKCFCDSVSAREG